MKTWIELIIGIYLIACIPAVFAGIARVNTGSCKPTTRAGTWFPISELTCETIEWLSEDITNEN